MKFKKNLKRLKGDASFRIFFRKKEKNLSSIIVFANKDKKKNQNQKELKKKKQKLELNKED